MTKEELKTAIKNIPQKERDLMKKKPKYEVFEVENVKTTERLKK